MLVYVRWGPFRSLPLDGFPQRGGQVIRPTSGGTAAGAPPAWVGARPCGRPERRGAAPQGAAAPRVACRRQVEWSTRDRGAVGHSGSCPRRSCACSTASPERCRAASPYVASSIGSPANNLGRLRRLPPRRENFRRQAASARLQPSEMATPRVRKGPARTAPPRDFQCGARVVSRFRSALRGDAGGGRRDARSARPAQAQSSVLDARLRVDPERSRRASAPPFCCTVVIVSRIARQLHAHHGGESLEAPLERP